jgi:hypothetical protein
MGGGMHLSGLVGRMIIALDPYRLRQHAAKKRSRKECDLAIIEVDEYAVIDCICMLYAGASVIFHSIILGNHESRVGSLLNKTGGKLKFRGSVSY